MTFIYIVLLSNLNEMREYMDILSKVGRYLFALPFGVFGLFHFMNASQMGGYVPGFIPGGVFWVYLTGLAMLAACVSILINKKAKLACVLLGAMLLIFVLSIHLPAVLGDGGSSAMTMLLKDTVMAGGAWILSGQFGGDLDLDLDD